MSGTMEGAVAARTTVDRQGRADFTNGCFRLLVKLGFCTLAAWLLETDIVACILNGKKSTYCGREECLAPLVALA
jgi:hypothetical protein